LINTTGLTHLKAAIGVLRKFIQKFQWNFLPLSSSFNCGNKGIQISGSLPYQKSAQSAYNTFTAVHTRSIITIKYSSK